MISRIHKHALLLAFLMIPCMWLSNMAVAQLVSSSLELPDYTENEVSYISDNNSSDIYLDAMMEQINLKFANVPVKEALSALTEGSDLNLVYNNKLEVENNFITANFNQVSRADALIEVLYEAGLKHQLSSRGNLLITSVKALSSDAVILDIEGQITDAESGEPLVGVSILVEGTNQGTTTDIDGFYSMTVPDPEAVLIISYVGYLRQEIPIDGQNVINVALDPDAYSLEEMVVVGYGTQRRSDITGSVASVSRERLEMLPNVNISQAIQGSVPGVMVQTSTAGAAPSEVLMVRGRNSITASNAPLIVVDGIPYNGQINDINPNDVESIEVLKDASSAAIYGSRGSNGVILVTTKEGDDGSPTVAYDGHYSTQRSNGYPDLMSGEEFYNFKNQREPGMITPTEQAAYDAGNFTDWTDMATRIGTSHQHNLSVSGGFQNTNYYISGGLLDVRGIAVNDNFQRLTNRINIDTEVMNWLTIGTRTQLSYDDQSGQPPSSGIHRMNPLSSPYDAEGTFQMYPWPEDTYFENPLENTLFDDLDESFQLLTNNYLIVDFPFITGLNYRINTGVSRNLRDTGEYMNQSTATGFEEGGLANTRRTRGNNVVIDNILSYSTDIGVHNINSTAVYSYEQNKSTSNGLNSRGFPHDFLSWYSAPQAAVNSPSFSYNETVLISQALRLNYAYDNRYLLTVTGRRDGFSGFGSGKKWGVFPSLAIGWNMANEDFFPAKDLFSQFKPRISYGTSGNQGVGAYETISRLGANDIVANKETQPGYIPSVLGQDELGWESSTTLNLGIDFGLLDDRFSGDINFYHTNTEDLLLNRTISPVHGITSITQNIGETENRGIEFSLLSRNVVADNFRWTTSTNFSYVKNEIVDLYGDGLDDVANAWFIGQPIRVNYNYEMEGVWQSDEASEATLWGAQPGYMKVRDVSEDGQINTDDRTIIGQQDPKALWGMTNSFSFQNFNLDIFVHGVHGVTKANVLMVDDVYPGVRRNTVKKNWWTPENPTNDFYMNDINAHPFQGDESEDMFYENASFVRVKDISLSYDLPRNVVGNMGLSRFRLYVTGRNLLTFTEWNGLDPELDEQRATPLQREFVFGVNVGF
ncbi:MAG: TonB-dependent receptor [Balneolales bacterium]